MGGDVFPPEKRSEVMSAIRSAGTKPERRLYEAVRAFLGERWRIDLNRTDLPGKPDLVIPTLRVAIFADGCFFHHCPIHGRIPASRREYWEPKIHRNVERDRIAEAQLREAGFEVWRFWEHELKTVSALAETTSRIHRDLSRLMTARRG